MSPMSTTNSNPAGESPRLAGLGEGPAHAPRRSEGTLEESLLKENSEAVEACFLWIDEESGDELVVEAQGSASFFAQLEALGFVPHIPRSGEGDEGRGEPNGVRRSARLDMASSGSSALPELWRPRLGA